MPVSGGNAAQWLRSDWMDFMRNNMPLIQQQMQSLSDNTIVRRAVDDTQASDENMREMSNRNAARFGINADAKIARALERSQANSTALSSINTLNNARLAQRDRNENAALALAEQGNTLRDQAMDNMLQASGIASNRRANNRSMQQAANNSNTAAGAAILSALIMSS